MDDATRGRLVAEGVLFGGYHAAMEAVHRANAAALDEIIDAVGWPGRALVGDAGADAAWRIAQHSIGDPDRVRRALQLILAAVDRDDAPAWQAAYLEDRVRSLEGRPQRYGTQHDWDPDGRMVPYPEIEDPAGVDERRDSVGLGPLADATAALSADAAASGERPPADVAGRRREMAAWARRAGWR